MNTHLIGTDVNRIDGPAKVSGAAKYAAEFFAPDMLYAVVVSGVIAHGEIDSIDTAAAMKVLGAIEVFSHKNRPHMAWFNKSYLDEDAPTDGKPLRPLYDEKIHHSGQPIALCVAETFEAARAMSRLVEVSYKALTHQTDMTFAVQEAKKIEKSNRAGIEPPPKNRGNSAEAFAGAPVKLAKAYLSPTEIHNPIELFATTVIVNEDGTMTIYDKTQSVSNSQLLVCNALGLSKDDVRVESPFVGGAFGSALRPQYQLILATMAAKALKRSVRLTLTRDQMFTLSHRPETLQEIRLGADTDGTLLAMHNESLQATSRYENYFEVIANWSGLSYLCENATMEEKTVSMDISTPGDMRAPGAVQGVWAIETAMDELAVATGRDPVDLRLQNYAEKDQNHGKKYSSKELKACYAQGAAMFRWNERKPTPRTERRGTALVGRGMAGGVWESPQMPAAAKATLTPDGTLTIASGTADIGTGTYTVMAILAGEALGLPLAKVIVKLGDSELPVAPLEGGSWTVSSVGTAVTEACKAVAEKVFKLASGLDDSPLKHASFKDVEFVNERISLRSDSANFVTLAAALAAGDGEPIAETTKSGPNLLKQHGYKSYTHSAVFAEVEVDEDFGTVSVCRVVSAIAGGRIINHEAARSQILGGVVWGIGMALQEQAETDHQFGRIMNHNLAEYHVPVNADVHDIEVIFVKEEDDIVNPIGAKGLGEIGLVGVAAAIGNAIYNATGKRIRELPITLDKLI